MNHVVQRLSFMLFLGFLCHGFLDASDAFVFLNCQMLKVKTSQIQITDEGHYIVDEDTNTLIPVKGFINQNNETFAIISLNNSEKGGKGFWGDTWVCSNCGYENYEGIETCALCGTSRNRRNR
jgi:hypothetical protein